MKWDTAMSIGDGLISVYNLVMSIYYGQSDNLKKLC